MIHLKYERPIVVCGTREGLAVMPVRRALTYFDAQISKLEHVVVGSSRGVDGQAVEWCLFHERTITIDSARWKTTSLAAGPRRNEHMADYFKPRAVLAFPGGNGTKNMVTVAHLRKILVWFCKMNPKTLDFEDWYTHQEY